MQGFNVPNCTTQVIVNGNIQKNLSWKTHFNPVIYRSALQDQVQLILNLH